MIYSSVPGRRAAATLLGRCLLYSLCWRAAGAWRIWSRGHHGSPMNTVDGPRPRVLFNQAMSASLAKQPSARWWPCNRGSTHHVDMGRCVIPEGGRVGEYGGRLPHHVTSDCLHLAVDLTHKPHARATRVRPLAGSVMLSTAGHHTRRCDRRLTDAFSLTHALWRSA